MSKQEIIEGNKLIAEFMQYDDIDCNSCKYSSDCNWLQCGLTEEEQNELLFYNSSWDWLMPVIKKCSQLGIFASRWTTYLYEGLINQDISLCYDSCIQFIKWYNLCQKEK